jgi:ATP-binding cassette subfamily B protein
MNPSMGRGPGPHKGPGGGHFVQNKVRVKDFRSVVKRLWTYFSGVKIQFAGAFILIGLTTLLQVLAPYFQGVAIDKGIIGKNSEQLIRAVLIMAGLFLFSGITTLLQNLMMIGISQHVVRNMRNRLFDKIQSLSLHYFDKHPSGELMSRVSNDIDLISQTLTTNLTQLISSVISISGVTVMMLILNIRLALIALITIPLIILITRFIAKYTRRGFKAQQQSLGTLNGQIEESVSALQTVKLFGTEKENLKEFSHTNGKLRKAAVRANIYGGIMGPTMNLMRNLNFVIVAFAGGFLAFRGLVSIGLIAVFLQYTRQFSRPLNQIAQLYNQLQSALTGAERVFTVMDEKPDILDKAEALETETLQGYIKFKNVHFSYTPHIPVLKDLTFSVRKGMTVAIVGETGAGKTTIVNLLTRFYDIDSGSIHLDGNEIRDLKIENLRKNLGFVLQDTFLFSDTVRENIRYGKPDATDKEIETAAEMANAHHFIRQLPDGYDTVLSEEGNSLSEGQKQLLAIARVILSDPSILILDEATSSVDSRTEVHIQQALMKLTEGRTSFIIAHRLNTIRQADNILVLDQGQIIEQGDHNTLISRKGVYHDLYSRAAGTTLQNGVN